MNDSSDVVILVGFHVDRGSLGFCQLFETARDHSHLVNLDRLAESQPVMIEAKIHRPPRSTRERITFDAPSKPET